MLLIYYIFIFVLISKNAFAYLDPGTFSIIGTVIASIFAGISGFVILLKTKFKKFFKILSKKNKKR